MAGVGNLPARATLGGERGAGQGAQSVDISYRKGVALVIVAALMWSLMGLLIRLVGDVGTWQVLFYRSLGMIPVLFAVIAWRSGGAPLAAIRATGWAGLLGGAGLVLAFAGAIYAIQSTTVANAVFMFSVTPLMTAVLGAVFLGEPVSRRATIAIGVALVGIFVMVREGLSIGAGWGNLSALASSAGFAVFTVLLRRQHVADHTPAILIGAVLSVAVAATVISATGTGFAVPPRGIAIAMLMGAVILGVGITIFALGGRAVPAAEMSLLALVEVMLGPVWVWLFLGETASAGTFIGGAILLAAIAYQAFADAEFSADRPGNSAALPQNPAVGSNQRTEIKQETIHRAAAENAD
ncbi:MAG: hypothetical protein RLZZ528_44 [Pseudomonadota bacterium]